MKTVDVLTKAEALLNSGRWTKNSCFRTRDGDITLKLDEADTFCAVGACVAAAGLDCDSFAVGLVNWSEAGLSGSSGRRGAALRAINYLNAASRDLFEEGVANVNDHDGLGPVLAVFRKAVRNAKRRHIHGQ